MRKKLKKRNSVSWVTYTVVLLIGLAMLYPIIWMFFNLQEQCGDLRICQTAAVILQLPELY